MNAGENALRIIRFDKPERIVTGVGGQWASYFGCNHEGFDGGSDKSPVGSRWRDIWNVGWHKEHEGWMGYPEVWPLADLPAALKTYKWPDPNDERLIRQLYEKAGGWNREENILGASHRDTLWERTYMLVGMENAMCYFHTEPDAMREVLHRIMDFQLGMAEHYLKVGVTFIGLGDDLGCQDRLFFSREILESFFVPEYRRIFDFYRKRGVLIQFHSCGHIEPILDVLMDLGVNVLDPVQATANDLQRVRAKTQGRMALEGAVRSGLVMDGPVEAIRREVHRRIWQLGRDGGYFCKMDQGLPFPKEHIEAFRAAVDEFGVYPLRPFEE